MRVRACVRACLAVCTTHHTVTLVTVVEPGGPTAVEQPATLVQTLAAGTLVTAGAAGEVLPGVPTVARLPPAERLAVLQPPRPQRGRVPSTRVAQLGIRIWFS